MADQAAFSDAPLTADQRQQAGFTDALLPPGLQVPPAIFTAGTPAAPTGSGTTIAAADVAARLPEPLRVLTERPGTWEEFPPSAQLGGRSSFVYHPAAGERQPGELGRAESDTLYTLGALAGPGMRALAGVPALAPYLGRIAATMRYAAPIVKYAAVDKMLDMAGVSANTKRDILIGLGFSDVLRSGVLGGLTGALGKTAASAAEAATPEAAATGTSLVLTPEAAAAQAQLDRVAAQEAARKGMGYAAYGKAGPPTVPPQ